MRFYESDEYAPYRKIRKKVADSDLIIVDGL